MIFSGFIAPKMLEDVEVNKIAVKLGKTPAQIILRFLVQMDISVIPKSTSADRLLENFQVNIRQIQRM